MRLIGFEWIMTDKARVFLRGHRHVERTKDGCGVQITVCRPGPWYRGEGIPDCGWRGGECNP